MFGEELIVSYGSLTGDSKSLDVEVGLTLTDNIFLSFGGYYEFEDPAKCNMFGPHIFAGYMLTSTFYVGGGLVYYFGKNSANEDLFGVIPNVGAGFIFGNDNFAFGPFLGFGYLYQKDNENFHMIYVNPKIRCDIKKVIVQVGLTIPVYGNYANSPMKLKDFNDKFNVNVGMGIKF